MIVGIRIAPMRKLRRVPNSMQVSPRRVETIKIRRPVVPEM